ncbi:MAG: 4Fe-4S dicluster domain-containing protein [Deltaproteobacteria bacterium]|nr:MAG: 4Fe-4S dicluster domain-containing protein [Deltaproteobacteria bacterium]
MTVRFVEHEKLNTCVHCGLCLAACPTYLDLGTETDSPRGRIHLMRALEEGALRPTPEVVRHLDLCLGCRACETACPSGVPYGSLIEAALLTTRAGRKVAFGPLRLVAGRRALGGLASRLPSRWLALAAAVSQTANGTRLPAALDPPGRPRGTAALLTGCVAESVFPATNVATARLLVHAGVRVLVPPRQGCCGAIALHLGAAARARALARQAAYALAATGADWVVSNAAGCGAALRDYDHLLPEDPHAVSVARRARDALELLAELGLPPPGRPLAARVAVHDPCHLAHGQGVRAAPRALLAAIPGVRLVELEEADTCCGSAGTYNLTEPAMADRLLARKIERIAASGADVVVAANPGCLLQIRAGVIARRLHVAVEHPIDLLATAHGVGPV